MSSKEQNFLEQEYRKLRIFSGFFWTGLNRNHSDSFTWADHSKLSYQNWKKQPHGDAKSCVRSSISMSAQGWEAVTCSEQNYFVCKLKRGQDRCYDPIGIQNHQIPDTSFTASSQFSSNTPPYAAKLYWMGNGIQDGGWCADAKDQNPWIQINLGKPERLTYLGLQGKANSDAFVTGFYIKYSMDSVSWDVYGDIPPTQYYKFRTYTSWRKDKETVMNLPLLSPFVAQYVRIYPIVSDCHVNCCLRVEFYGCPVEENTEYCGLGWKRDSKTKHCYQLNTKQTTWDAAESICRAQGSTLLSISSTEEQSYISDVLKPLQGKIDGFWSGLNDQDEEQIFRFSDDSPLLFNYWYSGFPKKDSSKNCALVRTSDASWAISDCTEFHEFICKKSYVSPYVPKKSFNNNIFSSTDYYWKMDRVVNRTVPGTSTSAVAKASGGTFGTTTFKNVNQKYLAFDGRSNYLTITDLESECALHPDSASCPHGFTMSFLFKKGEEPITASEKLIIDTLGYNDNQAGYRIFFQTDMIVIYMTASFRKYRISSGYNQQQWNHFAFTFSSTDGLTTYINGNRTISTHGNYDRVKRTTAAQKTMIIGKHFNNAPTKMAFGSLAMFERVLDRAEIANVYLADFGQCGPGQIAHGSYCYEFNSNEVDWETAKRDCQSKNGDLASIHSSTDQAFITMKSQMVDKEMWIGLSMKRNTPFVWSDGTSVKYTAWQYGEPNSGYKSYSYTRCSFTIIGTGRWNDHFCYAKKAYICKFTKTENPNKQTGTRSSIASYYVTMTIGCPLSQNIKVQNVKYGSKSKNCFTESKKAIDIVEKACPGTSCVVKATDDFFGGNPCTSYNWKMLNITYSCVDKTPDTVANCDGYQVTPDGRSCYKLMMNKATYSQAKAACIKDKAVIATIGGEDQQRVLTSMLSSLYYSTDVWVGLEWDQNSQQYKWSDGATVIYTKWVNRQPNPSLGAYVKVGVDGGGVQPMLWKPAQIDEKLPFFCQRKTDKQPTAAPITTPGAVRNCYPGWKDYKGYCYFVLPVAASFVDAEKNCSLLATNAHLASIMSTPENDFVRMFVYNTTGANPFVWLGLQNEGLFNGFRWKDGNPLYYLNWFPSRPYTGQRHLCGGMESNGQWFDLPCYEKQKAVCKIQKAALQPTKMPTTTPTPDPKLNCPSGWKVFNSSCYYISSSFEKKDYYGALRDCQMRNGSLASVLSKEENNFIQAETRTKTGAFYRETLIIGLSALSSSAGWKWSDGSVVNFLNFAAGQPNQLHGMESCVTMDRTGQWHDSPCNMKLIYACKTNDEMKKVKPTVPVPKDKGYCEQSWELYGDSCFLFELKQGHEMNFQDARAYCQSKNADLASIHSQYENAWVLSHAFDYTVTIYLGLNDKNTEKKFLWADQSSVVYTKWDVNEPSFHGNEDCVEMRTYTQGKGNWNDIGCEKRNAFVCKKESSAVKPTSLVPTTSPAVTCPDGFVKYRESCFRFSEELLTFDKAVDACKQRGSELVSISNIFEQAYIFSKFVEYTNSTWVGLSRDKNKRDFTYVDRSRLTYTFWSRNPKTTATERECVRQSSKMDWSVTKCDDRLPYICKIKNETVEEEFFVGNCSDGWEQYNGKCYKFFTKKLVWPQARKSCASFGGDLVTVDNYQIQKHLEYLVRDTTQQIWIGLNDRETEHVFRWSNGEQFFQDGSFSNWDAKEPNDNVGKENCVEMYSTHGKWNDVACSYKLSYICQHPLECNTPAGIEDGSLPDKSLVATSNYTTFVSQNARLNGNSAWCTNITDGTQSITIDLQKLMHVTRVSTQGAKHNSYMRSWTLTYTLEHSQDLETWVSYTSHNSDGSSSTILPGNDDYQTVTSNKVDIRAQYIRLTPKSFKGTLMCLRIEVYGCPSVCLNPLSSASSEFRTSNKEESLIQPATPFSSFFCSKNSSTPFYQLTFRNPVMINKLSVITSENPSKLKYKIIYGANGKNTTSAEYSTKIASYRLKTSVVASQITFVFINLDEGVCMGVELYGCLYECDSPLGISDKRLPNYLMVAKSSLPGYPASAGRLDGGYFGENSWCAKENDDMQYLQIDLTKQAHITGIATQGFYGNEHRYVTSYIVQYSDDADLWRTHSSQMGNDDGEISFKNKLTPAIEARYIRIVPNSFVNGICMRVELYGCPFEISGGVEPPNPGKTTNDGSSSGLSNGGKIGLIIFFILLIAVILIAGGVYYRRHRKMGFSLHKSFSNPVHMDINSDEIDIINYAE